MLWSDPLQAKRVEPATALPSAPRRATESLKVSLQLQRSLVPAQIQQHRLDAHGTASFPARNKLSHQGAGVWQRSHADFRARASCKNTDGPVRTGKPTTSTRSPTLSSEFVSEDESKAVSSIPSHNMPLAFKHDLSGDFHSS